MRIESSTRRRPDKCECTFRQFMVGDGCQYCNPGYAAQFPDDYKPVPDAPVPMEQEKHNGEG
ncbi:hypothetical protein [Luteimonas saliphila]|uniref:hypothetical protein n=1 Tax=Luteimonas saliphila TaxID=2804919 RepID=UPI00192D680E|nr:hypothetical protein [Luteimonas saliphila]